MAYGYRDDEYFFLKIRQAFPEMGHEPKKTGGPGGPPFYRNRLRGRSVSAAANQRQPTQREQGERGRLGDAGELHLESVAEVRDGGSIQAVLPSHQFHLADDFVDLAGCQFGLKRDELRNVLEAGLPTESDTASS